MSGAEVVFYLLSAVAVLTALGVILARNPVHSAFSLVVSFLNVAGIYVMLGAEFLAAVQVIVYTGAILVLFLFVIMLVRPEDLTELRAAPRLQTLLSYILGLALFIEIATVIATGVLTGRRGELGADAIAQGGGNTQVLGRVLYSEFLLPFEAASLVLLVAVVAAIVLGVPERVKVATERGERSAGFTVSLGHPRGTDRIEEATRRDRPIVTVPDHGAPGTNNVDRIPNAGTGRTAVRGGGDD